MRRCKPQQKYNKVMKHVQMPGLTDSHMMCQSYSIRTGVHIIEKKIIQTIIDNHKKTLNRAAVCRPFRLHWVFVKLKCIYSFDLI